MTSTIGSELYKIECQANIRGQIWFTNVVFTNVGCFYKNGAPLAGLKNI